VLRRNKSYRGERGIEKGGGGEPAILEREGIGPRILWLYNYKVDYRFK
jgi:hypothetical protein